LAPLLRGPNSRSIAQTFKWERQPLQACSASPSDLTKYRIRLARFHYGGQEVLRFFGTNAFAQHQYPVPAHRIQRISHDPQMGEEILHVSRLDEFHTAPLKKR